MACSAEIYIDYYKWLVDNKKIKEFYREYLKHILEHRKRVCISWLYICDKLCELGFIDINDMDDINELIMKHDESKLYSDEFIAYARRFNGPRQKNEKVKIDFKEAVKLHKERNLHHYESLKNYKGDDWKHYAIELICDYIAMGWEFNNYICEYFDKVKGELKDALPDEYYNYIESIIKIIPSKLPFVEKPLTNNNIDIIYYTFNKYEDSYVMN